MTLGLPYPQPHEDADGILAPYTGPSMHGPKGRHTRYLDAAIRIALREYETSRGREVDFTTTHVSDFAETVLARWNEAIITSGGMGS